MRTQAIYDGVRAFTSKREETIEALEKMGFVHGGLYCCSGELSINKLATKWQVIFGKRSNIGGRGSNKYFSLSKDFTTEQEAKECFEYIKNEIIKLQPVNV